jgi:hypothetical protein
MAAFGLVLFGASAPSWAQKKKSFGTLAKDAIEVRSTKALGALFWSRHVNCEKESTDLARRQCRGLKSARVAQHKNQTYLVRGDIRAFGTLKYKPKVRSIEIYVRECIACTQGVSVDGKTRYIIGRRGLPKVSGGSIVPPRLHTTNRTFKNQAAATKWRDNVAPRLRTDFLIQLEGSKPWKTGDVSGYQVKILGFRVYDPCDGGIICATPPSRGLQPNKRACGKDHAIVADTSTDVDNTKSAPKDTTPKIPRRLASHQIASALRPARKAALKCYDTYGVQGVAKFRITIGASGKIVELTQSGDFTDTPTGKCIEKAVRKVSFPQSRKARTTVTYPILVR